ncbi:MAG: nucleoside deaminase [Planctomycetaceae bacterium]|nr:nucleoside deaminase [Planctomycetaceae bacterium]
MSPASAFQITLPDGWKKQLPAALLRSDEQKMEFVISLGEWNIRGKTGGPFAAAIFDRRTHEIISIGVNRVVPQSCSLAHAEAVAIALAQQAHRTHDLSSAADEGVELFASGQPCVQCFGMTWWSGVNRLVIGARSSDIEELTQFREGPLPTGWKNLLANRQPLPPIDVRTDVCRERACELLREYTASGGTNYSPGLSADGN